MRFMAKVALALAVAGLMTVAAVAEEVTLQGKVACAKCTLKKPDAKACQNVLLVPDDGGKDVEYYIADNTVSDTFGEVCTDTTKATVTGTVSEKDGRKWITPSKMEASKS